MFQACVNDVGCCVYPVILQDFIISRIYPMPLENHESCHKSRNWESQCWLYGGNIVSSIPASGRPKCGFQGKAGSHVSYHRSTNYQCHWRGTFFGQIVHVFVERAQWWFHMSKCYRTICSIFEGTGTSIIWEPCFRRTQQVVNCSILISILLHCKLECECVAITQAVKQQTLRVFMTYDMLH